ncbi:MAG TPA: cadmium-translocating P-type ATPase [Bacteroidetes bacterium]|nr:cadmium-translocating P-type ATPase [Bacteroidota bacterium]
MDREEEKQGFEGKWFAHPPMRNALIAGGITGATFFLSHLGVLPFGWGVALYLVAIGLGGYHWMREGIEELVEERALGIEILMIFAAAGSAILGMWDEAATLVFLYGAAEGLEEYTYAKTRASIRKLLDLAPKEARVLRDGREVTIPASELRMGEIFVVRPGESIPTDGLILKGKSFVDEAPVTGESTPVPKREGMKVFAATVNQDGVLEIRATATFEDNTLTKMIHLVEEAQEQKGKTQLFIDRFGRIYTPLVLASALGMAVIPLALGLSFIPWATRAVVLLVAAAPCALIMSTPVAVAAGIGRAGRSGVLIKGGMHLENLGKLRAIAFDKTGTLTRGKPVVTDVLPINGDGKRVLQVAYSIERFSEHPLARAIVKEAEAEGLQPLEVADFRSVAGYGTEATVAGRHYRIGRQELLPSRQVGPQIARKIEEFRGEGKTVILVGNEAGVEGIIAVRDEIRQDAPQVVRALKQMHIRVAMLTGDSPRTAEVFARELGIDDVRAGLKPEEKINAVVDLERRYRVVGMVGDGINDAPALARATVGVAMGAAGTDAAIEAADVALMGDDLSNVLFAIRLGKKARLVSTQNIVFSLVVLAVLIPTALGGVLTVASAVFFHEASELLAVANGLRAGKL